MTQGDRLLWPDVLRFASIFCVILIHSAAPLVARYTAAQSGEWWTANLYDSFSRWCIPVFFMLSGAFLIDKSSKMSVGRFLALRLRRILVPFMIWSAIYFAWRMGINKENLSLGSFFPLLLREPVFYHLWFIYVLMGLYLLAPILGAYTKAAGPRNVFYALGLWICFGSVLPLVESLFKMPFFLLPGPEISLFPYAGYFLLGHALRGVKPAGMHKPVLSLIFLLALGITAYGTYLLTRANHNRFNPLFYEYWSPNVLLMATAIFLIGKSLNYRGGWLPEKLVRTIASCTPGIYFLHALLISAALRGMLGQPVGPHAINPIFGIPFFALAVFTASFILILILKRIPGLRWIVP